MAHQYLPIHLIHALHTAVIEHKLAATQEVLLSGLDQSFVDDLRDLPRGSPSERLLETLHQLNQTRQLPDGTVPLVVWLKNASQLTHDSIFKRALREVDSTHRSSHEAPIAADAPKGHRSEGTPRRRPTLLALMAAMLAALTTIAMVQKLYHEPIEPFLAGKGGVVVGGPWMAAEAGRELCRELKSLDREHAVRCMTVKDTAFRERARAAGAVVVATISSDGSALVTPLGRLEGDTLLGGTIKLDLGLEPNRARAAVVINALARLSGPRPDFLPDNVPCPKLEPHAQLDRIALLTLLVVPSCQPLSITSPRFKDACGGATLDADETCALALYLDAEHNPDASHVRENLEALTTRGPERFKIASKLKLARLDCKDRRLTKAAATVIVLSREPPACSRAQLPEIAACILSVSGREPMEEGVARSIEELEAAPVDPEGLCPEKMRATALARRAYWRGRGGRWDKAILDYQSAYALDQDPIFGLNLAEAQLHRARQDEARKVLDSLGATPDTKSFNATKALLRWIAARDKGDAAERSRAEATLLDLSKDGEPMLRDPLDEDLRSLSCAAPESPDCIYNVLRRHAGPNDLARAFSLAHDLEQGTRR